LGRFVLRVRLKLQVEWVGPSGSAFRGCTATGKDTEKNGPVSRDPPGRTREEENHSASTKLELLVAVPSATVPGAATAAGGSAVAWPRISTRSSRAARAAGVAAILNDGRIDAHRLRIASVLRRRRIASRLRFGPILGLDVGTPGGTAGAAISAVVAAPSAVARYAA
jgi:hypothetical protein